MNASLFCETDPLQGITPNLILGQVVPAGTGTVGVHSDLISSKGGVETLAKAATIDLDMDPLVVTSKTMQAVNADRVDPKTGTMREWTKRVKRGRNSVDSERLSKSIQELSGSFGVQADSARG